jgi:hypothetical protein
MKDSLQTRFRLVSLIVALLVMLSTYLPSLQLGAVGDDYEWWLAGRQAIDDPVRLIMPFGGFRPANMWIQAADVAIHGTRPFGMHITSILCHFIAGLALYLVLVRFAIPGFVSAGLAALWMTSPYSLKPAISLCERFEPMLMAGWLGLVLVWPRNGRPFGRGRLATILALAGLTMCAKESWVVLPGFVLILELAVRQVDVRTTLRSTLLAALVPVLYVGVYLMRPAIPTSYYGGGIAAAAKVVHSWAVFSWLTEMDPSGTQLGFPELIAGIAMALFAYLGWTRRCPLILFGLALYFLPFLPVLTVGFLVTRYTYVPLAGFVLAAAGVGRLLVLRSRGLLRITSVVVLVALWGTMFAASSVVIRRDLEDAALRDLAHLRLLAEAEAFSPEIPRDLAIVAVRLEDLSVNRDLLDRIQGIPKVYYERVRHPYGLIRWAPLLSWVLDSADGPLYEEVPVDAVGDATFAVIGHGENRFQRLPSDGAATAAEAVDLWTGRGYYAVVIRPWRP